MKTKTQHTPTPWKVGFKNPQTIESETGKDIAACGAYRLSLKEAEANADFIVRAVNSHEALLEAAKQALKFINEKANGVYVDASQHLLEKAIQQTEGK